MEAETSGVEDDDDGGEGKRRSGLLMLVSFDVLVCLAVQCIFGIFDRLGIR